MKLLCGLLLIFPLQLFANAPLCLSGDLSAVWTVGIASSPEGRLLYCELHSKATDSVHGDVIYRDPQGQVIAEKKIDVAGGLGDALCRAARLAFRRED